MNAYKAYHEALAAQKRIPEAEPVIMQDADCAYLYAVYVIQGRWLEAEPVILKDSRYSYCYARDIIKGRWPEAEPTILKDAGYAYSYAMKIIKGRWSEAEETIAKSRWKDEYLESIFNEPVVTKDEVSDHWWKRRGLIGYYAPASLFKLSLLDMMVKE